MDAPSLGNFVKVISNTGRMPRSVGFYSNAVTLDPQKQEVVFNIGIVFGLLPTENPTRYQGSLLICLTPGLSIITITITLINHERHLPTFSVSRNLDRHRLGLARFRRQPSPKTTNFGLLMRLFAG